MLRQKSVYFMNNKADRLKTALRENLKKRKAHMRDRKERDPETDDTGVPAQEDDNRAQTRKQD